MGWDRRTRRHFCLEFSMHKNAKGWRSLSCPFGTTFPVLSSPVHQRTIGALHISSLAFYFPVYVESWPPLHGERPFVKLKINKREFVYLFTRRLNTATREVELGIFSKKKIIPLSSLSLYNYLNYIFYIIINIFFIL